MNKSKQINLELPLIKFLIETSGHYWSANELVIQIDRPKSNIYRSLGKLFNLGLITKIGNTYTFNLELLGKERNITELRKSFKRKKQQ